MHTDDDHKKKIKKMFSMAKNLRGENGLWEKWEVELLKLGAIHS